MIEYYSSNTRLELDFQEKYSTRKYSSSIFSDRVILDSTRTRHFTTRYSTSIYITFQLCFTLLEWLQTSRTLIFTIFSFGHFFQFSIPNLQFRRESAKIRKAINFTFDRVHRLQSVEKNLPILRCFVDGRHQGFFKPLKFGQFVVSKGISCCFVP